TITFIKGQASRAAQGAAAWNTLAQASRVFQGDRLKTGGDARLEAKLMDGSLLRLGAGSELSLDKLSFSQGKTAATKKVTVKLVVGRVWASVSRLFGKDSSFEVNTSNAVAGVRGTRFAAVHDAAGSTTVRVYSGKVLVSNKPIYAIEGHIKGKRVEVPGPQEIDRKQWEELVAGAMQMVQITAAGEMSRPETFALADPATDDWEAWNAERDKLAGISE
ncbi:MAG: FecR domain-containing protein, partial [Deltaproteobacteria bacterium]|nr:FecR domain-containing protein [Deltaproteobacteria bacterium]